MMIFCFCSMLDCCCLRAALATLAASPRSLAQLLRLRTRRLRICLVGLGLGNVRLCVCNSSSFQAASAAFVEKASDLRCSKANSFDASITSSDVSARTFSTSALLSCNSFCRTPELTLVVELLLLGLGGHLGDALGVLADDIADLLLLHLVAQRERPPVRDPLLLLLLLLRLLREDLRLHLRALGEVLLTHHLRHLLVAAHLLPALLLERRTVVLVPALEVPACSLQLIHLRAHRAADLTVLLAAKPLVVLGGGHGRLPDRSPRLEHRLQLLHLLLLGEVTHGDARRWWFWHTVYLQQRGQLFDNFLVWFGSSWVGNDPAAL